MPDGTAYIVMELLEGETLSKRLARLEGAKLPLPEMLKLVRGKSRRRSSRPMKGIVHRDLKPDNVRWLRNLIRKLARGERVKLLDFRHAEIVHTFLVEKLNFSSRSGKCVETPNLAISPQDAVACGSHWELVQ